MELAIDSQDQHTLLQYKIEVERKRGYHGPCFISAKRLAEIHMGTARLVTEDALLKIRYLSQQ